MPTIIPITYVNSAASIKAFCGEHDGACCTSSNARQCSSGPSTQGDKGHLPPRPAPRPQHRLRVGYPLDAMVVYDPNASSAAESQSAASSATATQITIADRRRSSILWKGHCCVHGLFTGSTSTRSARKTPQCKVLVHPECKWEVVQKADLAGSTEYIIKTLEQAPPGSHWAVGTEMHLVNRLAAASTPA